MSEELNLSVELEIRVYDKSGKLIYTNRDDNSIRRKSKVRQEL